MTADISIEVNRKPIGKLIPVSAVQGSSVIRIRASKRQTVSVKTGLVNADLVEILDGDLVVGDQVVVKVK
jgi:multidrug efflux pump subunit AcrA (membrane-fusion protein)